MQLRTRRPTRDVGRAHRPPTHRRWGRGRNRSRSISGSANRRCDGAPSPRPIRFREPLCVATNVTIRRTSRRHSGKRSAALSWRHSRKRCIFRGLQSPLESGGIAATSTPIPIPIAMEFLQRWGLLKVQVQHGLRTVVTTAMPPAGATPTARERNANDLGGPAVGK